MALKLYNTLTRKKEVFKPLKGKLVRMYTCGPTVYDYAHIGNFRSYVFEDLLRRYLEFKGYKLKQVMNLTDVDDKTIKGSREKGISLDDYTGKYKKAFFDDLEKLNIEKAEFYPEATKHIKEMVELIKKLLKKKYAYIAKDGIYYKISSFKNYGKLSHMNIKELKTGVRIKKDEYKLRAHDFALWKNWDKEDGKIFWETEFGDGRPGWHIECSAMSMKYLGESFDIHCGGADLIFPHHENEIAQSEGATGKKFVKHWIHNEWLLVDGKKMSKSLGNFYTLRDLLNKGYDSRAVRYLLLSTHYRQQLNFTFKGLDSAQNTIKKFDEFILKLNNPIGKYNNITKIIKKYKDEFEKKMDEDLDITNALASLFEFMTEINKIEFDKKNAEEILEFMEKVDSVLGIMKFEKETIPKEVMDLVNEREKARQEKNFGLADHLREKIKNKGYYVDDTEKGPLVKKL